MISIFDNPISVTNRITLHQQLLVAGRYGRQAFPPEKAGCPPLSYDRSKVDLSNCDREPIHIPGSIQPHGAMIVLNEQGMVSFVSKNIDEFLGDTNRDYVGAELADLVGTTVSHDIANAVARAGAGQIAGVVLKAKLSEGASVADITAHRYEGRTFLELERPASPEDTEVALHLTQSLIRRVDGYREFDPLFKSVARLGPRDARLRPRDGLPVPAQRGRSGGRGGERRFSG
ncbi:hypothetical protein AB4Z25_12650 [Rhizobium sp. RAF36]|uniref:hypothetical protein n=1 Tax=Rhizobium sp. RAF36 TaxID=3233055 RepID=UPI003F972DA6